MKLYKTKKYYISKDILFDCPVNEYFDLDKNWRLVEDSESVVLKKKYRIDYIADLYGDMDYVRIISIINGKMKGVFSYETNDKIEIPSQHNTEMFAVEINKDDNEKIDLEKNIEEEIESENIRQELIDKLNDYRENRSKTISVSEEIEMLKGLYT